MNEETQRRRLWGSASWWLFCVAVVPSCGGSAEAGDSVAAPATTLDEACAAVASAACAQLGACSSGFVIDLRYGDESTCAARSAAACAQTNSAPSTSVTPEGLDACASALATESCDAYLDSHAPKDCQAAPGALADGQACIAGGECESTFCAIDPEAPCGVCGPRPSAGDACQQATDCGRDLVCVAVSSTCEAAVGEGGACDKGHPCELGFSCVGAGDEAGLNGSCEREIAAAGGACDPSFQSGADCAHLLGLFCDPKAKTCLQSTTAAPGEACGFLGSGGLVLCSAGGMCVTPTGSTTGTCLAPANDGETCDTASGPPCLLPARCVVSAGTSGTCALLDASKCP